MKGREPFLRDPEIRGEMHAFPGGVAKRLGCAPVIIEGTADHVHLLCRLSPTISLELFLWNYFSGRLRKGIEMRN